jgi:hypothetical protein
MDRGQRNKKREGFEGVTRSKEESRHAPEKRAQRKGYRPRKWTKKGSWTQASCQPNRLRNKREQIYQKGLQKRVSSILSPISFPDFHQHVKFSFAETAWPLPNHRAEKGSWGFTSAPMRRHLGTFGPRTKVWTT